MKTYFSLLILVSLAAVGCGNGDHDTDPDILSNGLLGGKTGTVKLTDNGCAFYRDIPVTEIGFSHFISAQVVGNDRLDITFTDNGYVCNALNFHRYGGRFDANCGIQPLAGFLPDLNCTQELVWSYSVPNSDTADSISTADVSRTAYVRCSKGDQIQFACPVEYRGSAFDCLRDLCPNFNR